MESISISKIQKELDTLQKDLKPVSADNVIKSFAGRAVRQVQAGIQKLEHLFKNFDMRNPTKFKWESKQERSLNVLTQQLKTIGEGQQELANDYKNKRSEFKTNIDGQYLNFTKDLSEQLSIMRNICDLIRQKPGKFEENKLKEAEQDIEDLIDNCQVEIEYALRQQSESDKATRPLTRERQANIQRAFEQRELKVEHRKVLIKEFSDARAKFSAIATKMDQINDKSWFDNSIKLSKIVEKLEKSTKDYMVLAAEGKTLIEKLAKRAQKIEGFEKPNLENVDRILGLVKKEESSVKKESLKEEKKAETSEEEFEKLSEEEFAKLSSALDGLRKTPESKPRQKTKKKETVRQRPPIPSFKTSPGFERVGEENPLEKGYKLSDSIEKRFGDLTRNIQNARKEIKPKDQKEREALIADIKGLNDQIKNLRLGRNTKNSAEMLEAHVKAIYKEKIPEDITELFKELRKL